MGEISTDLRTSFQGTKISAINPMIGSLIKSQRGTFGNILPLNKFNSLGFEPVLPYSGVRDDFKFGVF